MLTHQTLPSFLPPLSSYQSKERSHCSSMATSATTAAPQHGLFALPTLRSTLHRLGSYLNRTPSPSSGFQQQLHTLQLSLLQTVDKLTSNTQLPADLMSQFTDAIYVADDLVDELEYKALQEQVEQMTKAAADQESSEIQLNVFRGFQTGEDDVVNQGNGVPSLPLADGSQTTVGPSANGRLPRSLAESSAKNQAIGFDSIESNGNRVQTFGSHACCPLSICNCFRTAGSGPKQASTKSSQLLFSCLRSSNHVADRTNSDGDRTAGRWRLFSVPKAFCSWFVLVIKGHKKGVVPCRPNTEAIGEKIGSPGAVDKKSNEYPIMNGNCAAEGPDSHLVYTKLDAACDVGNGSASLVRGSSDSIHKNVNSSHHVSSSKAQEASYEEIIAARIMKIIESMDLISAHLCDSMGITSFNSDLKSPPEILYRVVSASNLSRREVHDRDGEIEQLVRNLIESNEENVCIFPIFGPGGVGKTTLAHSVYSDERIEKYFHSRVWICASDDINVMRIAGVTANPPSTSKSHASCELEKLDFIEENLKEQLKEMRFLLVLDDVDSIEWMTRFASLKNCGKGSKIIITAREEGVVDDRGKRNKIVLKGLKGDNFFSFFRRRAFGNEDPHKYPDLQIIAKGIATKLKGSPLAAKIVGGLLQTKFTNDHWTKVFNELLELEEDLTGIMPALRLCYQNLPPPLKWCFAYCSVFPKGYPFDVDNLINTWISQGFIQTINTNKRVEDVGREYFDHLVSRSFFELPNYNRSYWQSRYHIMHDLLHDLVKSVGASECSVFQGQGSIQQTTSHLFIKSWAGLDTMCHWKHLRSVVVNSMHVINFGTLTRIRVLDLSYSGMRQLPDAIGNCMHLRFLNLSGNNLYKLPESLCRLWHLQFLIIPNICHRLPKGVNNLINLRHLNASDEAVSWIAGIGRLISLQKLKEFNVRLNKGHDIGQLKDMRELRGQLCIRNLDGVGRKEEVIEANLNEKTRIEKLQLKWRRWKRGKLRVDAQEVLECLQPPPGLKELGIHWFTGCQTPSWLKKQSLISLQSIHLRGCKRWQQLPPFGHLPFLEVLRVEEMNATVDGGVGLVDLFPSLRELWLADTSILFEGISFQDQRCKFFHQLRKLTAKSCEKVKGLPPLAMLSSLEELEINKCPDLESELPECLKDLKSLTTLKIVASNLTSFPGEEMQHLKHLEIDSCPNLVSWLVEEKEGIHHSSLVSLSIINSPLPTGPILMKFLTSLRELKVDQCSKITVFTPEQRGWFADLTSLQELCITSCENLAALPANMHQLLSLEKLTIKGCPKLRSLPNSLPASLKRLDIFKCNSLLLSQWQGEEAPDWVKSIPFRSIA